MNKYIFFLLILSCLKSYSQTNRNELTDCNIFYTATYKNQENVNKSIFLKDFVKDTIIYENNFRKFKITEFEDFSKSNTQKFIYESFKNDTYVKLDEKLNVIQKVNFTKNEQNGILFSKNEEIKLEYVDTRNSFPRDSLIPDEKTPKKFFSVKNPLNYFVLLTDFKTNQLEINNDFYTKQLFGESIYRISKNYRKNRTIKNEFKNIIGDEVQVFYRRKWYNEKTGNAEYEDKQFKNFKYIKDTLVNNQNAIILESEGYNFLSGREEEKSQFVVLKTNSAFILEGLEIPIKNYETEMKILPDNSIFLQSVIENKIDGNDFPLITQFNSNSYYTNNILPFFPMAFLEVGNVEGFISYAKINGKEYGTKRKREFKTDKTSIWTIRQISNNEIELNIYVKEKSKIIIEIGKDQNLNTVFNESLDSGEHTLKLKTEKLIPKQYYNLNLNYELENSSGSIGQGFTAK